ncbi:hypothetical protein [Azohydromonas aeria]|uniref:hypothetical protein n=1 Tax=Azohydromonas aeria TaxID=2590212 RepID=UPI0018DF74AD|nr:hypothetical protein [Azohydromonas aeria]
MLKKTIHFREGHWLVLHDFMRAQGIASPSIAIERLIETMTNNNHRGTVNDRADRTTTTD